MDAPETTSIKHRSLTLTARTPQCGHSVWGKNGETWRISPAQNVNMNDLTAESSRKGWMNHDEHGQKNGD